MTTKRFIFSTYPLAEVVERTLDIDIYTATGEMSTHEDFVLEVVRLALTYGETLTAGDVYKDAIDEEALDLYTPEEVSQWISDLLSTEEFHSLTEMILSLLARKCPEIGIDKLSRIIPVYEGDMRIHLTVKANKLYMALL